MEESKFLLKSGMSQLFEELIGSMLWESRKGTCWCHVRCLVVHVSHLVERSLQAYCEWFGQSEL